MEKLHKANKLAVMNISRALSKMTGEAVSVRIIKAKIEDIQKLSPLIPPDEIVAGVYLPISGDVKGAALLIFPKETAFVLSDLLIKKELGTTRKLSKLDKAALEEMGNIVSGKYLGALSNELGVKIIEHIPSFSYAMFGAILSQVITNFIKDAEKALVVELEFDFKKAVLKGYFLILLKLEDITAIIR